jgi:hypothetical protein
VYFCNIYIWQCFRRHWIVHYYFPTPLAPFRLPFAITRFLTLQLLFALNHSSHSPAIYWWSWELPFGNTGSTEAIFIQEHSSKLQYTLVHFLMTHKWVSVGCLLRLTAKLCERFKELYEGFFPPLTLTENRIRWRIHGLRESKYGRPRKSNKKKVHTLCRSPNIN